MEQANHIHQFVDTVVPATCLAQGYTLHRCSCGYEYKDTFVPAGNHQFTVAEETNPTCTQEGSQILCCTVCGITQTRMLPADHSWSDWRIQTMPTCTEPGTQIRSCTRCGQTEEETIKATGHHLTSPHKSETEKGITEYFCTNCGQTVQKPSFWRKNKKRIISAAAIVVILAILAIFVLPMFAPFFHYQIGKLMINFKNYEQAYSHLKKCGNYQDSKELLEDFVIIYESESTYLVDHIDGKPEGVTKWTYDKNTKTITESEYKSNGALDRKVCKQYDKAGNLICHTDTYVFIFGYYKEICEYDEAGNLIRSAYCSESGDILYEDTMEYDKSGYMISKCRTGDGETTTWTYTNNPEGKPI